MRDSKPMKPQKDESTQLTIAVDWRACIRARLLSESFDAVGFTQADLAPQAGERLQAFLAAGYHGDMGWLEERVEQRSMPQKLWPQARTAIVVAANYAPSEDPLAVLEHKTLGAISAYARRRDYHDVLKKRLRRVARWLAETSGAEVKLFVDTAPLQEKPLAMQAGLGWQGKHSNLVSRRWGSWLFLGEILTSLEITPDEPESDHCGSCQSCLTICPTNAFPAPYQLDARRCIAYLTIEHKGSIPHEFRPLIGNRVFGCDDCLAVCPWNKFATTAILSDLEPYDSITAPGLSELVALDAAGFRKKFAGTPVKRTGYARFLRNVLIAIGNSGAVELLAAILPRLHDSEPLIRGAAIWALGRLATPDRAGSEAKSHICYESDQEVQQEWSLMLASMSPDTEISSRDIKAS